MTTPIPVLMAVAASLAVPAVASAHALGAGFDVTASATAASDYRFRGVSLSDRDPVAQGSIDVSHESGFYAGVWGSTIERYQGATVEVDAYAGYQRKLGPVAFDVGVIGYLYPRGVDANVFEATGSAAADIGPARLRLSVAYAPDQRNLLSDSLYVAADVRIGVPHTPLSLTAKLGRERGDFVGGGITKIDWSLGLEASHGPVKLGVAYVDTDVGSDALFGRAARGGVVATLSATF